MQDFRAVIQHKIYCKVFLVLVQGTRRVSQDFSITCAGILFRSGEDIDREQSRDLEDAGIDRDREIAEANTEALQDINDTRTESRQDGVDASQDGTRR